MIAMLKVEQGQGIKESQEMGDSEYVRKQFEFTNEELFQLASILVDEGYGSFDRCLKMLQTVNGDGEEARKQLSELTFKEFMQHSHYA